MNILIEMFGGYFCLAIVFIAQPAFVWFAAKLAFLDCAFKEAAAIATVCALLLIVPMVGLLLSCVALFVLLIWWLHAEFTEAVLAFSVTLILESVLIWFGVREL